MEDAIETLIKDKIDSEFQIYLDIQSVYHVRRDICHIE